MKKISFSLVTLLLVATFSVSVFAQSPTFASTYTHSRYGVQFNYPSAWSIFEETDSPLERPITLIQANNGGYVQITFEQLDSGITTKKWFDQQSWPRGISNLRWWSFKTFAVDDHLNFSPVRMRVVEDKESGTMYFVDSKSVLYTFENGVSRSSRGLVPQIQLRNIVKSAHFLQTK